MTTTDATHPAGLSAGHPPGATADHHEQKHHVCSTQTFLAVLMALFFFTFLTVLVSRFDFGGANMWIAMAVASVKAALVMAVFMHLIWDTTINKIFFLASFTFLGLLFLFIFADLLARSDMEKKHGRVAPLDYTQMQELNQAGTVEQSYQKRRAEAVSK